MKIRPEILVSLMVLLLIGTESVGSLTRTISNSNDNVYTFIRNSNGNYWEAASANIQLAINDLNNKSGTVWLPGGKVFYLTETLIIHKNVILDMGGSSFKLPQGVNANVVELKDGSGVKNGVIDVSGHDSEWPGEYTTNTSFTIPSACIYLNASSYINSASIENVFLEAISDGYNLPAENGHPRFYSNNYSGLGYGIYLHATDTNVPQRISNLSVKHVYLRSFKIGIYLNNERHSIGNEIGAFIERNSFEYLWFYSVSWGINITRDKLIPKDKCSVSYNRFNMIQMETGQQSWWGGEELTWGFVHTDGVGNSFTNLMMWDYTGWHRGPGWGLGINLTADSEQCYVHIYGCADGWINNEGTDNTLNLVGENEVNFYIGKTYELFS